MYATVAETRGPEPTAGSDLRTTRVPRVVTNDAMRDHWSELLPARSFGRWRHSQVAAFRLAYPKQRLAADAPIVDELGLSEEGPIVDEEYLELSGGEEAAAAVATDVEAVATDVAAVATDVAAVATDVAAVATDVAVDEAAVVEGVSMPSVATTALLADENDTAAVAIPAAASAPADEATRAERVLANGAWVAPPPLLSVEAQQGEGGWWHVPIPLGEEEAPEEQRWLCFEL